jgi:citrate lyase subunit beta/citryl-CoA lyase
VAAEAAAVADSQDGEAPPILPIATETPGAVFDLGTLREVAHHLVGVSWGAEDLPAAIGAATAREADGRYTAPFEMVRSLTLFAAHAAGVAAIDTVFPNIKDEAGLAAYVGRAARDGFSGMLAIHPSQVAAINAGFTPSAEQLAHAQSVVDAFAANPAEGVLQMDGKMIDAPHLKAALSILTRA